MFQRFLISRLLIRVVRALDAQAKESRRIADSLDILVRASAPAPRPKPTPAVFDTMSVEESEERWRKDVAADAGRLV